jgi:hypothetical protein
VCACRDSTDTFMKGRREEDLDLSIARKKAIDRGEVGE